MRALTLLFALLAAPLFAREAPIFVQGGKLEMPEKGEGPELKRKVTLGAPGVWYMWVKASNIGRESAVLRFNLDGKDILHSSRRELMVQRKAKGQWHSSSRYPGFRLEVHAEEAGEHELVMKLTEGSVEIEKIAFTLFYAAGLEGDKIVHVGQGGEKGFGLQNFSGQGPGDDPASGEVDFKLGDMKVDGFRKDWASPPMKPASRSFYIDDKGGDDANDGLSPAKAWKTTARASLVVYRPGDAILLKRGGRWNGSLSPRGNGTAKAWIQVGAYGQGDRPEINGNAAPGFSLGNQSYWSVQDLKLTSDPDHRQSALAITALKGAPQPKGIRLTNLVAYDSGAHGILVGNGGDESDGYDGVVIENCLTYANRGDGIAVSGHTQKSCKNTVIRHCTAYSNLGMAGIWILGGQNGLIERCVAYNNACINIWTWNAINITMRHCEAYRGRPGRDAGGFDIDFAVQASTMEYCYAHHNEGIGFLLMGSGEMPYLGYPTQSMHNLMRNCVALDNDPGIGMVETLQHTKIYNNLSLVTGSKRVAYTSSGWPKGPGGWGGLWPSDIETFNNIFVGRKGAALLWIDDYATRQNNSFDHNLYWRTDPTPGPMFRWGGRKSSPKFWEGSSEGTFPPDDYASLEAFRKATGQEKHGVQADPGLKSPWDAGYGRLPLEGMRLKKGSPAFGAGGLVPKMASQDKEWLAARRKHLTNTGAEAYGIPMEPAPDDLDYWGKRYNFSKPDIGVEAPQ